MVSDTGRPVDLLEDEQSGGHTIARHVAKSDAFLLNRVRTEVYRIGFFTIGLQRAGSFSSLEAANKLVNSTLAENLPDVESVASGRVSRAVVERDFASPTGNEAYRRNDRAQAILRDAYSVRVVIRHDRTLPRGYRVITAYPFRRD